MSDGHNLLVISDLHLGEDLGSPSEGRKRHVAETEAALVDFLAHYAERRTDGRAWKLIVDGDVIDFLAVALSPADLGIEGSPDDELYGFGASEVAALAKIKRVVARHRLFFDGLGAFVEAGHQVHFVTGNHDAELHFEAVRDALRDAIQAASTAPVEGALYFHPWFFLEPGMAYVEHGHQYDPFCSFDDPLMPEDPVRPGNLEENLGTAAMRYLGNHLPVDPDAAADLSFFEYLHLLVTARRDTAYRFLDGYRAVVVALGSQWWFRLRNPRLILERRKRRKAHMKTLATMTGVERGLLEKLHRLRRPPVFVDLLQLIRSVMLGRLLSGLLLVPLALVAFVWGALTSWSWALGASGGVVIAVLLLQAWLAWGRDNVDPTETMARQAYKIARLMRAPVVVFGHSHVPLARSLGAHGWYFNIGSWAGGADRPYAFTHLVATRGAAGVHAALCRWRSGESRELRAERVRFGLRRGTGTQSGY